MRLPPLITWSDVRWILFVVAGLGFLYAIGAVILLATDLPSPWTAFVLFGALAVVVALIALELRRFWMRFRR
jgi:hypothetical protein